MMPVARGRAPHAPDVPAKGGESSLMKARGDAEVDESDLKEGERRRGGQRVEP